MSRQIRCVVILAAVATMFLGSISPLWGSPETQATRVHVVQWGETLGIIAPRYGVTDMAGSFMPWMLAATIGSMGGLAYGRHCGDHKAVASTQEM
jgi:hypothetical protein